MTIHPLNPLIKGISEEDNSENIFGSGSIPTSVDCIAIEPTLPCHNQTLSVIASKIFTLCAKLLIAQPVQERDAMPSDSSGVAGSKNGTLVGVMWIFWGSVVDKGG